MVKRTVLTADEGYILTDGNIYGKVIYLAEDRSENEFSEISEAEYEEMLKQDESGVSAMI